MLEFFIDKVYCFIDEIHYMKDFLTKEVFGISRSATGNSLFNVGFDGVQ